MVKYPVGLHFLSCRCECSCLWATLFITKW